MLMFVSRRPLFVHVVVCFADPRTVNYRSWSCRPCRSVAPAIPALIGSLAPVRNHDCSRPLCLFLNCGILSKTQILQILIDGFMCKAQYLGGSDHYHGTFSFPPIGVRSLGYSYLLLGILAPSLPWRGLGRGCLRVSVNT
ncbi:hypothetical protein BDW71DRAFT_41381 [Aspergillus fruticulosus]